MPLSALVCASPAFLALYERQARLWIELRGLRLCMHAVGSVMAGTGLNRELLRLAQASENVSDRRTGFAVDKGLIDTWTGAVRALAESADALPPGERYRIDRDNNGNLVTKTVTTTDPVIDNTADTINPSPPPFARTSAPRAVLRLTGGGRRTASAAAPIT
jgi:hypothetical protein